MYIGRQSIDTSKEAKLYMGTPGAWRGRREVGAREARRVAKHLDPELVRVELSRRSAHGAHGAGAAGSHQRRTVRRAATRSDWNRDNGTGSTGDIAKVVVRVLGRRATRGELRSGRRRDLTQKHHRKTTRDVVHTGGGADLDNFLLGDVLLDKLVERELGVGGAKGRWIARSSASW